MYLTVIIDLFHRKVIATWNGWAMSESLNTNDTIIPAWNMAAKSNAITKELIFHSDRGHLEGSQYGSHIFTNTLKNYDGLVKQSMSRKGNCWDNAGHPMQWQNHSLRA